MREKYMFAGSSCAGVVSAAISCFFIGLAMLIWGVWDIIGSLGVDVVMKSMYHVIVLSLIIWLLGWMFLHIAWKSRKVSRKTVFKVSGLLILTGVGGTLFAMINFFLT